jgi:glycosyltransferase involved in cell wall biosynthesis
MTTVTIVIPTFNGERWLAEAIDSALSQTHRVSEIIVVDDGSTDRSVAIAEAYGAPVRVHRRERNGGIGAARNDGVILATGEWIKFLDADDTLRSDCVATQLAAAAEHGGKRIAVFGRLALVDWDGRFLLDRRVDVPEGFVGLDWVIANSVMTTCPLFRTEDVRSVGLLNEDLPSSEDYDLIVRIAISGVRILYRDTIVYDYRQHQMVDRVTLRDSAEVIERAASLVEEHLRLIDATGRPLTQPLRVAFGNRLWALGRGAARMNAPRLAKRIFERAREICPDHPIPGTRQYRLASALLSPVTVEWLSWNLWHRRRATIA